MIAVTINSGNVAQDLETVKVLKLQIVSSWGSTGTTMQGLSQLHLPQEMTKNPFYLTNVNFPVESMQTKSILCT